MMTVLGLAIGALFIGTGVAAVLSISHSARKGWAAYKELSRHD